MSDKNQYMRELVNKLNQAAQVYYQGQDEILSNFEYDKLYDELVKLEQESGVILAGSPTQKVGYEVIGELPKERHQSPMLSLDKTKEVEQLVSWLGSMTGILSWKLDGLTVVLTYENGRLAKAVTRGNGQVGEVITNNARVFQNIPLTIPCKGKVVLRGEAVIPYSEFERINRELPEEEQYKNPRNLCSGSVRQLNNEVTAKRHVHFFAFALVTADGVDFGNSQEKKYTFLKEQGFDVVEYKRVNANNLADSVAWFSEKIPLNDFPSDGLVLVYDDIAYGESLGTTAKFPRNAIAFKWADEIAETTLKDVQWSASRTGLINPVAIFEPVELEGTTVSRASVHNVSIVRQLELGIGDRIQVYKANMIIPQISENLTRSGTVQPAEICPVCKCPTKIHNDNGVEVLFCENKACLAKKIKAVSLFVSRDAMNIDGMSEATVEKLMDHGLLHQFGDLFRIAEHRDEIIAIEGFGEKSYERLVEAVNTAKYTTAAKLLYSLGIPNVGPSNARMISKAFGQDFDRVRHTTEEELVDIDGVGGVIAKSVISFFADEDNNKMIDDLLSVVILEHEGADGGENSGNNGMEGIQFVITGSVNHYANRSELKQFIESRGGKVTASVTSKTNFLINNDTMSNSSKNKKAKELNIPVLTEDEFIEKFVVLP